MNQEPPTQSNSKLDNLLLTTLAKYRSSQADPSLLITPSTLYNPIVNKDKASRLDGFKSFSFKEPEVFEEQLRNKIFFIAKNSLETGNKDEDMEDMTLNQRKKMESGMSR